MLPTWLMNHDRMRALIVCFIVTIFPPLFLTFLNPQFTGFPPPIVIWRSNDGRIIDETYESLGPGTNVTRNGLSLPRIERNHLLQELSCEAFPPTSSTVLPSTSPSSSSSISSSSSPYTSMVSSSHQSSLSFIRRSSVVLDLNRKCYVCPSILHHSNTSNYFFFFYIIHIILTQYNIVTIELFRITLRSIIRNLFFIFFFFNLLIDQFVLQ